MINGSEKRNGWLNLELQAGHFVSSVRRHIPLDATRSSSLCGFRPFWESTNGSKANPNFTFKITGLSVRISM